MPGTSTEARPDTGEDGLLLRMVLEEIDSFIANHEGEQGALISILEDIQDRYHYLPEEALRAVARGTGRSLVDIYGVATFYKAFSLAPRGKHLVSVCLGTACHVRSASDIVDEFATRLGLRPGETGPDGEFTLETVNCLGTCALGPIVTVDGRYFSRVTRPDVKKIIRAARAGFAEEDAGRAPEAFPAEVLCPHCGVSLVSESASGGPSVVLGAEFNGTKATVSISGLLGPVRCRCECAVPPDTVAGYTCPGCGVKLTGKPVCIECGAPMALLSLAGGGLLMVCSRWGCANSVLRLGGSSYYSAFAGRANETFPG